MAHLEPAPNDLRASPSGAKDARRGGLSIRQKLLLLILLSVAGSVAVLAFHLPARQLAELEAALDSKAETYGRLVSKQVESAVAFGDQATAREVFDAVAQDPDIAGMALYTSGGALLQGRGAVAPVLEARKAGVRVQEVLRLSSGVGVAAPVVSLEGPRGTLLLQLSGQRLEHSRKDVLTRVAGCGFLALLLGAIGAFWISRSIGERLRAIAHAADAVASGNLDQEPVDAQGTRDEIGTLASAFNTMLGQLRAHVAHIRQSAAREQERLEALVAARTQELNARNADMHQVLDNVGQGFLSVGLDGKMSRERSLILEQWLGSAPESGSFAEYVSQVAPEKASWIELSWQMLIDDLLPVEVTLDQLPKQLSVGEMYLGLEYRPIFGRIAVLDRVLVVISDITAEKQRARAEMDEREVTRLFTRLVADRAGFVEFFAEAHALVTMLSGAGQPIEQVKSQLHTIKGNAAIFGLDSVATTCHELEDKLSEQGNLSVADMSPLATRWNDLSSKIRALVGDHNDRIEIADGEYRDILDAVERGISRHDIRRMLLAWKLEPTEVRLSRIAAQALGRAKRLDKDPLEVRLESGGLRLRREEWSEFWSTIVHVVRNAVDHGLETPDERRAAGKPVPATLQLRTRLDAERFVIEVADNGRGVDWNNVRGKAQRAGLPAARASDLTEALLTNGFSTREGVTDLSGRGVGLAAAREACRKRGGKVEIESVQGQGTTVRFVWPAQAAQEPAAKPIISSALSSAENPAARLSA